jgi:hypothetical protein
MSHDVIITNKGGSCPYQAEGTILGRKFYFRARGNQWSFSVSPTDPVASPIYHVSEPWGETEFAAGYMNDDQAVKLIRLAAARYVDLMRKTARVAEGICSDCRSGYRLLAPPYDTYGGKCRHVLPTGHETHCQAWEIRVKYQCDQRVERER